MYEQTCWLELDFYAVLGVSARATSKEVTLAYRHKLQEGGACASIKEAYDVLGDASKRCEYDRVRDCVARGEKVCMERAGGSRYNPAGFAAV